MFQLDDDQISYGIGIHGENGYKTENIHSSELLANELINKLHIHFKCKKVTGLHSSLITWELHQN